MVAKAVMRLVCAWDGGGPGHGLQHRAVKVRLAAVADPARDRQHEVDAGVVQQFRQLDVVLHRRLPAIGQPGDRHAAGAVGREGGQQEFVVLEEGVLPDGLRHTRAPGVIAGCHPRVGGICCYALCEGLAVQPDAGDRP